MTGLTLWSEEQAFEVRALCCDAISVTPLVHRSKIRPNMYKCGNSHYQCMIIIQHRDLKSNHLYLQLSNIYCGTKLKNEQ